MQQVFEAHGPCIPGAFPCQRFSGLQHGKDVVLQDVLIVVAHAEPNVPGQLAQSARFLHLGINLLPQLDQGIVVLPHVAIDRLGDVAIVGLQVALSVIGFRRQVATLPTHRDQPLDHLQSFHLKIGSKSTARRQ